MKTLQMTDQECLTSILLSPIISEKATFVAEKNNQIMFRVLRNATKAEIKSAVELLFKVGVVSVQTVQRKGKVKRSGRKNHIKNAYVTLQSGQEINFSAEGV